MQSPSLRNIVAGLICLCASFGAKPLAASPDSIVAPPKYLLRIDSLVNFLVDDCDTLTIKQIIKQKNSLEFEQLEHQGSYVLSNTQAAHWLAFQMENSSKQPLRLVVELDNARLDSVLMYAVLKDSVMEHKVAGKKISPALWDMRTRNPAFQVDIPAGRNRQLYFKVKHSEHTRIPLKVYTRAEFETYKDKTNLIFTLFYGILFVIVVHNFFLFLAHRDFTYLMYLLVNGVMAVLLMNLNGFPFQYAELTILKMHDLRIIYALLAYLFLLFTIGYLRLRRTDKILFYGFSTSAFLFPILAAVFLYLAMDMERLQWYMLGALLVLLFVGALYQLQRHRYRPTWHYLSAMWVLLLGVSFYLLALTGKFPANFWMEYALQVGIILCVSLLSMGLSERQKLIDKEKEGGRQRATYISELMDFLKELHQNPDGEKTA
ncbi:MAG: 7TM diverse intracellular signaling domain-containing protein [Chitinophagales bacterium]|nr:7TM diverse intracellular signaling domain-containing protein [Chitinophagales bacterium]